MSDEPTNPTLDYASPVRKKSDPLRLLFFLLGILSLCAAAWLTASIFNLTSRHSPLYAPSRVRCESNLRQIGQAIVIYANENNGAYPDSLATVIANEDISPRTFICPETNDTDATGLTTQAIAADLTAGGHLSYIYVGRGWKAATVPANAVVAYEPLTNHGGSGMNVLFGDGHVQWLTAVNAKTIISNAGAGKPPVIVPSGQ